MKLGDNPELRKLAGSQAKGSGSSAQPTSGRKQRTKTQQPTLPDEFVFDSFYGPNNKLRPELFFDQPKRLAAFLHKIRLPSGQPLASGALRSLYIGFRSFAAPLAEGRIDFHTAVERFGRFYVQQVVRQVKRGYLPSIMQEFFEKHRQLIMSDSREMLGMFEYLKNILCYFGEKEGTRRQ